jgi:hypothetical protein
MNQDYQLEASFTLTLLGALDSSGPVGPVVQPTFLRDSLEPVSFQPREFAKVTAGI